MMKVNLKRFLKNTTYIIIMATIWFGVDCLAGISIDFFEIIKFAVVVLFSVIIVKKVDKKKV